MTVGNGNIPLRIGNLINGTVYGGPYRNRPDNMFGVKMAAEIDRPCDVDIPTEDFSVPSEHLVRRGVVQALMAMANGQDVYAGCMGGIGRTGLFLAVMAKVQIEYRKSKHRAGRGVDPVMYVRQHFIPHAVETQGQMQFIADIDVSDIVTWVDVTQRAMGLATNFQAQPETPDPAHDLHKAGWKAGLDGWRNGIQEQVERDLESFDMTNYDDGETMEEQHTPDLHMFESLQSQIDELAEREEAAPSDDQDAWDMFFNELTGWTTHPGYNRENATPLTINQCADMADEMLRVRAQRTARRNNTADLSRPDVLEPVRMQIEELDGRVTALGHLNDITHTATKSLRERINRRTENLHERIDIIYNRQKEVLTNASWFSKIRGVFKK